MNKFTRHGSWAAVGCLLASLTGTAQAMDIGAFGDVSYVDSNAPGDSSNFAIGGLDLYTMQKIDDQTKAFFETVFENDGQSFVLDVERYWLQHQFSEGFQLAAGRFHAPLGYWNRNYHHGVFLQDTVSRPGFLEFEDGQGAILPMHIIGLMATGQLGSGLGYEASIGNSDAYDTSLGAGGGEILLGNVEDQSNDKTFIGRLTYAPMSMPLKLGLFAMTNNLNEAAAAGSAYGLAAGEALVKQTVFGLDGRYEYNNFDVLAEYYNLDNKAQAGVGDGSSHTANAYYAQFGYRFAEKFKAVYRHEAVDFDNSAGNSDEYFTILGITQPNTHDVFALRYDVSDSNALMLEVNKETPDTGDSVTTTTLNWSFLIF